MPVIRGSFDRLARHDAGRLDLDAARLEVLAIGPLPSIGWPRRVDHAAEQTLAHRHLDDAAGALDDVAFLDVCGLAHDGDADVVLFEVEHHPGKPPPGNSTSSPASAFSRPYTRAMPSPAESTVPVSATSISRS